MPPKAQFIKGETDKQNFIKIKNACSAKDAVKRMKRQAADCEKTLANRTSDRGLVSRMYKEHRHSRKQTIPCATRPAALATGKVHYGPAEQQDENIFFN